MDDINFPDENMMDNNKYSSNNITTSSLRKTRENIYGYGKWFCILMISNLIVVKRSNLQVQALIACLIFIVRVFFILPNENKNYPHIPTIQNLVVNFMLYLAESFPNLEWSILLLAIVSQVMTDLVKKFYYEPMQINHEKLTIFTSFYTILIPLNFSFIFWRNLFGFTKDRCMNTKKDEYYYNIMDSLPIAWIFYRVVMGVCSFIFFLFKVILRILIMTTFFAFFFPLFHERTNHPCLAMERKFQEFHQHQNFLYLYQEKSFPSSHPSSSASSFPASSSAWTSADEDKECQNSIFNSPRCSLQFLSQQAFHFFQVPLNNHPSPSSSSSHNRPSHHQYDKKKSSSSSASDGLSPDEFSMKMIRDSIRGENGMNSIYDIYQNFYSSKKYYFDNNSYHFPLDTEIACTFYYWQTMYYDFDQYHRIFESWRIPNKRM